MPKNEIEVYSENRPVDLSEGVSLKTIDEQKSILAEYTERRNYFRKWLLKQLKEGVHFGWPPGCETKYDDQGRPVMYSKGKWIPINPKQWQAKPSLYKSGALLIIDLLKLQAIYSSDMETWEMLGRPQLTIVRTCKLVDPKSGNLLGQGTGAYKVGKKSMDENSAIKMADKSAAVAAVINTFGIVSDLFTQDIEDKPPAQQSSHLKPEMEKDFYGLVQEWVDKQFPKGHVMYKYKAKDTEIKALRANISIWCKGKIPASAKAAIDWCKQNVKIEMTESSSGEITGIKFVRKS